MWQHASLQVSFDVTPREMEMKSSSCLKHFEILMRLLAAFSITDVISSMPVVLSAPMATLIRSLLCLAKSTPGHLCTKTQSVQKYQARRISASDRHNPHFKLRAQAWTTAQQHAPSQRGSMEDSTELWPHYFHPTQTRPTLGTQTLPGNFLYGLYQCDNMQMSIKNCLHTIF